MMREVRVHAASSERVTPLLPDVDVLIGMWLLYDASKREVFTQPQLNM